MEIKKTRHTLPWLAMLIIVWNAFDIALHIYVDLVEPLRVAGNIAAIVASVIVLLGLARTYAPHVLGFATVIVIGLNITHAIANGFFVPSLVFIGLSVLLLTLWTQGEWRKANFAANTANPIYLRWWAAKGITLVAVAIIPLVGEARELDLDSLSHDGQVIATRYQDEAPMMTYE